MGKQSDDLAYQGTANGKYFNHVNGDGGATLTFDVNFSNPTASLHFEAVIDDSSNRDWVIVEAPAAFRVSPDTISGSGSVTIVANPLAQKSYLLNCFQDGKTLSIGSITVVAEQDITGGPYAGNYS